ncbi:hypothetical protein ABIB66_008702 [Bradyrhizobium sp. F1.13.3]
MQTHLPPGAGLALLWLSLLFSYQPIFSPLFPAGDQPTD